MLSRERSPAGLKSALDACKALVSPETSERITTTLLGVLPKLNGDMNLEPENSSLDKVAVQVLLAANPGAGFYTLWVNEFEAGDANWRKRLWTYAHFGRRSRSAESLEPFLVWAENRLGRVPTSEDSDGDTFEAADMIRSLTLPDSGYDDHFLTDRIFTALKNCKHLGSEWWLSRPLVHRSFGSDEPDTNLWRPTMKSEIISVAVNAMQNDDTPLPLVVQACSILANGAELTSEQRTSVVTSLANRLTLDTTHFEKLIEMVPIVEPFAGFTMPQVVPIKSLSLVQLQMAYSRGTAACPVLEMLSLAEKLDAAMSVQPQLDALMIETQPTLELFHAEYAKQMENSKGGNGNRGSFGSGFNVELTWPELASSDKGVSRGSIGTYVPGNRPLGTMRLWGTHEPTKPDWLKYLILLHPVMKDTVDAALAKLEPAAAEIPAEKQDKLPTY